ncbi:MAG: BatA domain-containing protein [Bacteroidota bacterium]
MSFSNPVYLWGLLGLMVPLAIHLWSKRQAHIVRVGSIRNFPVFESKKSRSVRLNEIVLLFLRSFLVLLFVFTLAGLSLTSKEAKANLTLIDQNVLRDPDYAIFIDSLAKTVQELRLFAPGFPMLNGIGDTSRTGRSAPLDHWDMINSLASLNADSIVIYSKTYLSDFKGDRPLMSVPFKWLTLPEKSEKMHIVDAYESASGRIRCFVVFTGDQLIRTEIVEVTELPGAQLNKAATGSLEVKLGNGPWLPVKKHTTRNVSLFYSSDFEYDGMYLKAAIEAIENYLDIEIEVATTKDENIPPRGTSIWLSIDPPPDSTRSRYALIYQHDEFAESIIVKNGNGYVLTDRLDRDNVFEKDLVGLLLPIFHDVDEVYAKRDSLDTRVMPSKQITSIESKGKHLMETDKASASTVLWALVALLLMIERVVAHRRKQ